MLYLACTQIVHKNQSSDKKKEQSNSLVCISLILKKSIFLKSICSHTDFCVWQADATNKRWITSGFTSVCAPIHPLPSIIYGGWGGWGRGVLVFVVAVAVAFLSLPCSCSVAPYVAVQSSVTGPCSGGDGSVCVLQARGLDSLWRTHIPLSRALWGDTTKDTKTCKLGQKNKHTQTACSLIGHIQVSNT